jgi:hypothetical protein
MLGNDPFWFWLVIATILVPPVAFLLAFIVMYVTRYLRILSK